MEPAIDIDEHDVLPFRLPKGFAIGEYVVDGWLRDGGMATIYRARRRCDDRRVALKLQLSSTAHDPMICARFDREGEVMRRAENNPHVVELYDAGVLPDGRRYFVMEWIEGENLEDLLDFLRNQDQRLPIVRACRIGLDVARGLTELHEHGVLHLDLKPANVMVAHGVDDRDEIKLVDFGVAADLHETEPEPHAGLVMGTSGYMAPEQLHGEPPNPSFDVYALGVLMFESLAGTSVPPDGWTPETLPRVDTRRRGVPKPLAELVHDCMDFDPTRRPASPREVATALARIILGLETSASANVGPVRSGKTKIVGCSNVVAGGAVRTGGTEVALRSEVMPQAPARTGGTEVVPRQEADEVAQEPRAVGLVESSQSSGSIEPWEAEDSPKSRAWVRWAVLGAVAAAIVATWIGWDRGNGAGDDAAAAAAAEPRDGTALATVRSTQMGRESGAEGGVLASDEGGRRAAAAVASARDASSTTAREESTIAKMPAEPRSSAAEADACRKARASAEDAKRDRAWAKVLRMTEQRGCWTGTMHRRDRKRLRVQAYAELGEFHRCVREAGDSTDGEITSRVGYCMNGLGAG